MRKRFHRFPEPCSADFRRKFGDPGVYKKGLEAKSLNSANHQLLATGEVLGLEKNDLRRGVFHLKAKNLEPGIVGNLNTILVIALSAAWLHEEVTCSQLLGRRLKFRFVLCGCGAKPKLRSGVMVAYPL